MTGGYYVLVEERHGSLYEDEPVSVTGPLRYESAFRFMQVWGARTADVVAYLISDQGVLQVKSHKGE